MFQRGSLVSTPVVTSATMCRVTLQKVPEGFICAHDLGRFQSTRVGKAQQEAIHRGVD